MVLKKAVEPGTLILQEKPFIYALSSKYRNTNCDFCFQRAELQKCSNCRYVFYCSKSCQKEAWPVHKLECKHLKKIAPKILPDAARLLARLIQKLNKGGGNQKSHYTPTKFRMFKDLMSHYQDLQKDKTRMEHFVSLYGVLLQFLDDVFIPNEAELLGIYGKMCVNSYSISDDEFRALGTGVYLAASVVDHSCKPNAVAIFQGTTISIRVTEKIPSLDWNKIFISYIDTLQSPEARRKELQSNYYFLCECPNCLDREQAILMNSAACPNRTCSGPIDPAVDSDTDSQCSQCDTEIPASFLRKYKNVIEATKLHLQEMKLAYLDVCKFCLKRHRGVLHRLNIYHVTILDLAFESSIDFQLWDDAIDFGLELLDGYKNYLGTVHPLLGILYLKLAKLLFLKEDKDDEALGYLKEASRILSITHGMESQLVRNELLPLLLQHMPYLVA